jgi:peroxiredoxin Q/BCP
MRIIGGAVVAAAALTTPAISDALELGKTAPDFTLPDPDGKDVSLKQYRGQKLVLIEFFGAAFAPT